MAPKAVSEVRERFSAQIDALVESSKAAADALTMKGRRLNTDIDRGEWNGDLFDLEDMAKAFDREENTQDVVDAISDPEKPGVVGDLHASSLQGDYLAVMERAYRLRHMTPARRRLHAGARRAAQGNDQGVFRRGVLGLVEGVLRQSKDV